MFWNTCKVSKAQASSIIIAADLEGGGGVDTVLQRCNVVLHNIKVLICFVVFLVVVTR